ncbi:bifunctional hydroxymethylpyrimidine kinase/phosphomethylpyrimidine kinase [Candidatus Saccharibacteria bacterium]|nr:bifunctional hydroxymethylpyrimidine kinase/phosphomethylpyrimidine kinase [Candidatus Saccharibacteria bacterium]
MKTIVVGSLNTDLVATGIERFPKAGEHVYGKELLIGPGGKSRNIADMLAHLTPENTVAMVGRTVKDDYGLWRQPMDALERAGVTTDYVHVLEGDGTDKLPGIALIPVDRQGNNQIIVLPGVSDDFDTADIDAATKLFEDVAANDGTLVLTLECPLETASYAVQQANKFGLKVLFDPGGIQADADLTELLGAGVYLIKPNEHEAKILTGVDVKDFDSAKQAAEALQQQGVSVVMITTGVHGAYLFSEELQVHIPVPDVSGSDAKDETGCGDQTMAAMCAFIQAGKTLKDAATLAVLAGTMQFHRLGIQPVLLSELPDR